MMKFFCCCGTERKETHYHFNEEKRQEVEQKLLDKEWTSNRTKSWGYGTDTGYTLVSVSPPNKLRLIDSQGSSFNTPEDETDKRHCTLS